MKKVFFRLLRMFSNTYYKIGAVLTVGFWGLDAFAGIPSGSTTIKGGDAIQIATAAAKEGAQAGDLIMYIIAGVVYVGALIGAFLHARKHKEWGSLGAVAIIGAIVMVIILIVLNHIKTAIGNS